MIHISYLNSCENILIHTKVGSFGVYIQEQNIADGISIYHCVKLYNKPMEVWDKERFFSPYSRLMPKCTLSPTRRSQQERLKRNVPWQPKVLLGPTKWRLWRKRRNNQSFHDRISSEELNIEFRINGCQKIDVLIKTKHDKRPRSRSADFLAVTFL